MAVLGPSTATLRSGGDIVAEINRLADAITDLEEVLKELEPIIRSSTEDVRPPSPPLSPLAGQIETSRKRIEDATRYLRGHQL